MAVSFHPELTDDTRIHERFAAMCGVQCVGTRKDTV